MYYSILVLAFFMMSGNNMEQPNTQASVVDHVEITKEKMAIVNINPLRGKYTVQIGQQLRYSASVHGSVGYTASASSSDSEALPLSESFIEYDDEERAKMSGGDAATKYFIFDVKKAGVYQILASHYFRGDLEHEYTIEITVEE